MFKQVIAVVGMPRSGTSWLGQIFNSSPDVRFRMEPIFSYAFKNAVNAHSSTQQFESFFEGIYKSDDDFMRQLHRRESGEYPTFFKKPQPDNLVFKTSRYHHILRNMLIKNSNLKIVAIVRHPCGAISSWLNTPSEFPEGSDINSEWKTGHCRNKPEEEFWGFDDWKSVTSLHLGLQTEFPDKFKIVRYESLVRLIRQTVEELFSFCRLDMTNQTLSFIEETHGRHDEGSYSVYKSKKVASKWQHLLPENIVNIIYQELKNTELNQFLSTSN